MRLARRDGAVLVLRRRPSPSGSPSSASSARPSCARPAPARRERLVMVNLMRSPTRARTAGPGTWSPKVQALNFTPGAISMILCVVSRRISLTGDGSSGLSAASMLSDDARREGAGVAFVGQHGRRRLEVHLRHVIRIGAAAGHARGCWPPSAGAEAADAVPEPKRCRGRSRQAVPAAPAATHASATGRPPPGPGAGSDLKASNSKKCICTRSFAEKSIASSRGQV